MALKTLDEVMREALEAALERALVKIVESRAEEHLLPQVTITETGHGYKVSVFAAGGRDAVIDVDPDWAIVIDDEIGAVG